MKEVAQAVTFYERAFGLTQRLMHESGTYAEMETDTTTLAFASNDLGKENLPQGFQPSDRANLPAGIEVGFVTDDVAAAFKAAIEFGAESVVEPKLKPWGQTVAYVRDLDGNLISINSPMGT